MPTADPQTPPPALGPDPAETPPPPRTLPTDPGEDASAVGLGTIGPYGIVRALGRGGMGAVHLCRDPESGADVAVKSMLPDVVADPRYRRLFLKEAQHMKRMDHPNVVPVLEVHEDERSPYYVMPFLAGGSVRDKLRTSGPARNLDRVLAMAIDVARGLEYAHDEHGLVHRDIKPENVLLGEDGVARVADFGLVKTMFNDSIPQAGKPLGFTVGTRPYMAPEVAHGRPGDFRVDVYSLGAMLYHVVAGCEPYVGTPERVLEMVKSGPPDPVRSLNPDLPEAWCTIIEGAMAREQRDRYAQMRDLREDLERLAAGEAPIGPAATTTEPVRPAGDGRRAGSRRLIVLGGGGLFAALAVAAVAALGPALLDPGRDHDGTTTKPAPASPTPESTPPGPDQAPPAVAIEDVETPTIDRAAAVRRLVAAIGVGQMDAVRTYVERLGTLEAHDVEAAGTDWPLLAAVRTRNAELVDLVAALGITPNLATTADGRNAIQLAYELDALDVARTLVRHGFRGGDAWPLAGGTIIHQAAAEGRAEWIPLLASTGADVNQADAAGLTPLLAAIDRGRLDAVRALLASPGIEVDRTRGGGLRQTALHLAVERGLAEAIPLLADAGADLEAMRSDGATAAVVAVTTGTTRLACLRALLDAGASPTWTDELGDVRPLAEHPKAYGTVRTLLQRHP